MHHERLITGVAAAFAAMAVVLTVAALAGSPVAFPVALAFAAAAYLMYDQLSGRMAARVYRRVEDRARANSGGRRRRRRRANAERAAGRRRAETAGGFGAGPREEWEAPRGGRTAREAATGQRHRTRQRRAAAQGRTPGPSPADRAAYETLGLEAGADEAAVRSAYRERVKEAHPDAPEGSRERFKAVKDAYEQLTD